MPVTTETTTVYRGGGRRWLSLKAAINAEAKALIKRKHPTEPESWADRDPGWHWTQLPRSDVLLRRVCRLIRNQHTGGPQP